MEVKDLLQIGSILAGNGMPTKVHTKEGWVEVGFDSYVAEPDLELGFGRIWRKLEQYELSGFEEPISEEDIAKYSVK